MNKKAIIGLMAAITVASAVSLTAFTDIFAMGGQRAPIKPAPIHHKETIGSLAYEFRLDSNAYGLNDEIKVYAKVTNVGSETIAYTSGSSSCPIDVGVSIVHQDTASRLAIKQENISCTADLGSSELAPNETVEEDWTFIGKQWIDSKLEPADTGAYDVRVALPSANAELHGQQSAEKRIPSTVTITLRR